MLLDDARKILAAWDQRVLDDETVVAWADDVIEHTNAADIPAWLLDLSVCGPTKCTARPSADFIWLPPLSFSESFGLRARVLDLGSDTAVEEFVEWLSRACIGESLDLPEVRFGYDVEHLWGDCDRMDLACERVRATLPTLRRPLDPLLEALLPAARQA